MSKQLLAKGLKYGELSLDQHLLDTKQAAKAIFQGRILRNWCRFFRVSDPDLFLINLEIACLFHDAGKANAEFDALVRGNKKFQQTLRHEWLSALILHLPSVRSWLEKSELDLEVITAAVLCHHLQASRQDWGKSRTVEKDKEIELYLQNPEVVRILKEIANLAQVEGLPELPEKWVASDRAWDESYKNANRIGAKFSREVRRNETRRGLLLAVKAGLIAADSVASGIFRIESSEAITQWVEETLHRNPITREEIEEKILQPRYRNIEEKSGQPFQSFKLKPFQKKATELSSRLLLLSGCGTGKTIFAYKWMQGVLENHEAGHVIFLYPTRGTATEGFKDYVSWAPESDASLLTGTALYELKAMQENPSESNKGKNYETDERLYALGFWGKRFFSATVDQFLSFLTHSYSGICLLPVLTDSVVVIDEVHSFDRGMFNNLVSFLEHFDIPVLCMTATLPTTRRQDLTDKLENKGLEIFPTEDRSQLEELEKAETRPRYIIQSTSYETAYTKATEAYREGKRVLWVVNTVNRCREIANQLEDDLQVKVLTYHSRFRLKDRQNRHSETVSAFQGNGEGAIAVTTQVCEMSLDLDADVLITELAPISALVQRFGRSNRSHKRQPEERAQIWVYEPEKVLPYKKEELAKAKEFITEVSSFSEVSQRTLAEKLEHYSPKEDFADGSSGFVTGGYWATSESFRDINDYSVSAILDSDLEEFLALKEAKNPKIEGLTISVPKQFAYEPEHRPENLPRYLKLADHTKYSKERGFGE